ncbi:hypothetical protein A6V39_05800 [Candidatus Mycoplasma haematobovis]|uniref:Uncharacterized protein n=1 Tax=Candidatus Mycoplasma haematobovis TaxID=432608 RepID=A0A1A9QEW9_9MOLU|nr:hypothetical protein [Candidatus Mycoplasma haematobovis]OAL10788.1 hypothetical protein A6V39_05800 [Candidatus Mycoplasma haematobovis]
MALLGKASMISVASATLASGGVYCVYQYNSGRSGVPRSFEDYKLAFFDLNGDDALWNARLEVLKNNEVTGSSELLKSAKKNPSLQSIRKACGEFYSLKFISNSDKDEDDFKKYCTKTNKDVLGNAWVSDFTTDVQAEKIASKISSAGNKAISPKLDAILKKYPDNKKNKSLAEEVSAWCKEVGESVYLGETIDFNNSKEYCKAVQ